MLRTPLSRPRLLRQFSTTPSTWNTQRPVLHDPHSKVAESERPPNAKVPAAETPAASSTSSSSSISGSSTQIQASGSNSASKRDSPLTPSDFDIVKKRIREWTEQATITLRHRADDFTTSSKTTFSKLGAELNKVTGYEEIEALKKGVAEQEQRISACRQAARTAKRAYEEAVVQRSDSQREVNDLLQRKSMWNAADVARFTSLVPQDHLHQQEEARAKATVDEAEDAVEKEFSQLMRLILARYHEEQVWSDKIRSASTYGSLAALGLNMLVFIMAILVVEPWKRKRLAQTFEDKIVQLSAENERRLDGSMTLLNGQIGQQAELLRELRGEVLRTVEALEAPSSLAKQSTIPITPQIIIEEVVERTPHARTHLHVSQRQLEIAAIGAGAFVAGILSSILLSRP